MADWIQDWSNGRKKKGTLSSNRTGSGTLGGNSTKMELQVATGSVTNHSSTPVPGSGCNKGLCKCPPALCNYSLLVAPQGPVLRGGGPKPAWQLLGLDACGNPLSTPICKLWTMSKGRLGNSRLTCFQFISTERGSQMHFIRHPKHASGLSCILVLSVLPCSILLFFVATSWDHSQIEYSRASFCLMVYFMRILRLLHQTKPSALGLAYWCPPWSTAECARRWHKLWWGNCRKMSELFL